VTYSSSKMKLTLLLLAPLAAYASNATTAAAGNGTAATTAAAAAGNGTAATTAAAPAGTTAAAASKAAASTAATNAAAATKAAAAGTKAGNTTAAGATDKKVKIAIPAVKVTVDFTVCNTAALKKDAATAVYDGVKVIATGIKTGGALFAKFDALFGTTGLPGTTGYDAARRLASHAKETVNDFKYVVTVPAAEHAATMTAAATSTKAVTAKAVGDAIKAKFTAKGTLGNVTVTFDPAAMAVTDPAPAGTGSTSGAAAVTGFAAMVFTGLYSLF